jgi:RNA polymerase sigma-70 factor (ECF subfamily)
VVYVVRALPSTAVSLPPFWTLVEAHGGELLAHARRLTGDDAEDVLQEALLRALRAYPKLKHADHLRAWLYRVTTTTAYDHHRGRARRPEVPTQILPEPSAANAADGNAEIGADFLADDAFESLLKPLPDQAQQALRLRFVQDLEYDAIAAALDISVEAARQRVSTAVRTLRKELA